MTEEQELELLAAELDALEAQIKEELPEPEVVIEKPKKIKKPQVKKELVEEVVEPVKKVVPLYGLAKIKARYQRAK